MHLTGVRIVDQSLSFPSPAQDVVHGRGGAEHRTRGIDSVAALLENRRTCRSTKRFAGDRDPVTAVEDGLDCALRVES